MGEQQRIAGRRFDGPETVELDDKTVLVEKRRSGNLAGIVKINRRVRVSTGESFWDFEVPAKLTVVDFEIDRQWDQKSIGHGVAKAWTFFEGLGLHAQARVEGLLRHGLAPSRQSEPRRQV